MKIIHLIGYASQPDIQFVCDDEWSIPSWQSDKDYPKDLPEKVHKADNNRLYTFYKELVTCEVCKAKDKSNV